MPQKVSGFTDSPSTWNEGKVSTAIITLEYASGLKVLIEDSLNGVAGQNIVSASGQGAMIGMMYSGVESPEETAWIRIREKDGGYRAEMLKTNDEVDGMALLLEDFVSKLRKGEEPSVSLSDGFNALSLDLSAISAIQIGCTANTEDNLGFVPVNHNGHVLFFVVQQTIVSLFHFLWRHYMTYQLLDFQLSPLDKIEKVCHVPNIRMGRIIARWRNLVSLECSPNCKPLEMYLSAEVA